MHASGNNARLATRINRFIVEAIANQTYWRRYEVVEIGANDGYAFERPGRLLGQAFGYDTTGNWSNLLSIAGSSSAYNGCTQGTLSVSVNGNNQIVGDTYDAARNLMTIPGAGGATYVFNAENQMTSTSNASMNYIYDGDGNRVEKSGSKLYWYSGSEVLDETDTTGSVTNSSFNEYIFFGGNRVARRDKSNNVFYYLTDQVGSSRVIAEVPSGQNTATMCYDADFEPFGGEHAYTNSCSQNYKFTSKERDSESNLDNFGARYYASTTGRFMSPDWALKPLAVPYAKFGDPQTLNLYTYVENSPLNRIDADGHAGEHPPGACSAEDYCTGPADPAADGNSDEFKREAQNTSSGGFWQKLGNAISGNGWKTDAQLKQDQSSNSGPPTRTPAKGAPNTTVTLPAKGGSTDRTYGPDGRATTDIDRGHDHTGVGDPHAHDWDWSKPSPDQRQDPRPLTPEEAAGSGSSGPNQQQRQAIQNATTVGVGVTGGFIILDTLLSILN